MKTRKSYGHWQIKENCKLEALKYQTRSTFAKNSERAYNVSREKGWLDEICRHMIVVGNYYNKCIYACEFPNNFVYVGLTYNFEERKSAHLNVNGKKLSSVTKFIIETNLVPNIIRLTEYISTIEAIRLEEFYLKKYIQEGWYVLNQAKTGSIGGRPIIWDFNNCKNEALKYETRNEFRVKSSGAYDAAHKHGWLNDITIHMLQYRKYEGFWTKVNCQKEALKYNKRTIFARKSAGAYDAAHRNNWLNDICKHMK